MLHAGRLRSSLTMYIATCAAVALGGEQIVGDRKFQVPDGLVVELAAGPPLVDRPITADFDDLGRLYVADSSGTNDPVNKQLAERPHQILRLVDSDGDGRFDQRTVFADKMMFPEGTMWLQGSLYVAAPPSIWKLTDTDDDGVADQRVEWFAGKTLTGCANDLHGPYRGPDGWIYWCKGAFAEQTYERPGRPPLVTKASHIFRARPDGTGIEPVMSGGMDNPVDVVFTPGGERIFTTTFLQHPSGGRRDGLIHAVYGGLYGKEHDVLDGHPRTSPDLMPVLTHLGPAAPCGLAICEGSSLGAQYQGNLFACLFNMRKVTRHVLADAGATFTTADHDFLVADDLDFHPTDVIEDADGSLLVVNTGGWYKLCCPTSQLHKPDVLGCIYRVRKTGALAGDDARGLDLDWSADSTAIAARLADLRPAVRRRATETLAARGDSAVPAVAAILAASAPAEARLQAVWTLSRLGGDQARELIRNALSDSDPLVRAAAAHMVGLHRDRRAVELLSGLVATDEPHVRRAAAEALGRLGDAAAVPALLAALAEAEDRVLAHSLVYALFEIRSPEATLAGLNSNSPRTRQGALVALDQIGGILHAADVAPLLDSSDTRLAATAWWIISRHPEWGDNLREPLERRLLAVEDSQAARDELSGALAQLVPSPGVQQLLAETLVAADAPPSAKLVVLAAMQSAAPSEIPQPWMSAVAQIIVERDAALVGPALAAARAWRVPSPGHERLSAAIHALGSDTVVDPILRLQALASLPARSLPLSLPLFEFVTGRLGADLPVAERGLAADVCATAALDHEQLVSLAAKIRDAGPLELERLLAAYEQSTDADVGLSLISALAESAAIGSLTIEALRPRLERFGPSVHEQSESLFTQINALAAARHARLEEILSGHAGGDIRRGQEIFNGKKAACSTCHAIGYLGGDVGPDLTRIGPIRSQRDLLESIVFPSASLVRSFEPVVLATTDGRVYNGILKKDTPGEVLLVTGANQSVRLRRDEIEEMQPSLISVMPAGLEQQLSTQDLVDLVAFLKSCQ